MRRGFTLLELLIVVATIAILAAIAVPNFLEAQVRSKVARMKIDMMTLHAGLKSYYADYQVYPQNRRDVRRFLVESKNFVYPNSTVMPTPADSLLSWWGNDPLIGQRPDDALAVRETWSWGWTGGTGSKSYATIPPFEASGYDLVALTTPVAYIDGGLLVDVFCDTKKLPLRYMNLSDVLTTETLARVEYPARRYMLQSYGPNVDQSRSLGDIEHPVWGPYLAYDPTNGTISNGDLLEFGTDVFDVLEFNAKTPSRFSPSDTSGDLKPTPTPSPMDPFGAF